LEALKDLNENVVVNAVTALGKIGDPRALDDLRSFNNKKNIGKTAQFKANQAIHHLQRIRFESMAKMAVSNVREMSWQDFEDSVTEALHAEPSDTRTSDMGVDGITPEGIPIQIKQSDNIGRNVIDNFETALRRYYPSEKKVKKGIIVAFSFTRGAHVEVERARREENIEIKLVTVDEIIG